MTGAVGSGEDSLFEIGKSDGMGFLELDGFENARITDRGGLARGWVGGGNPRGAVRAVEVGAKVTAGEFRSGARRGGKGREPRRKGWRGAGG